MIKSDIKASRREVRNFGLLFSGICAVVVAYLLYEERSGWIWFAVGSSFFLLTGLFLYPVLKPIYVVWMKFAHVLAWVNTRIILGIAFYLIVTPTGFLMRLMGKDLLEEKMDRTASTYWKKREKKPFDRSSYERMF